VCSGKISCYYYYSTEPLYNIADANLPSLPLVSAELDTGQYSTVWQEYTIGVALAVPRTLIFYLRLILLNNDMGWTRHLLFTFAEFNLSDFCLGVFRDSKVRSSRNAGYTIQEKFTQRHSFHGDVLQAGTLFTVVQIQ